MKKIFLTLVVLLMVVSPAFSENVTMQTAQRVAQSFLNSKMEGTPQIHLIDFAEKSSFPNFYVFGNEQCFVIISADNGAQPVLGYSIERGFVTDSLPDEVRDWLKAYNDEITSAMELRVEATPRIRSEWESLLSGRGLEPKSSTSVNPLITTHWRQYAPYNNLCPADPNAIDGHAKAGCGAVAMAQFMKYWEHPISGVGEHSYTPSAHPEYGVQYANFGETVYDWDNMLDNYSSGYSDAEALAVATLVYHCGVSVNMNYRPNGSSCNSYVIDDALMAYFDYSPNTKYIFKETYTDTIPDETWKAMLKYDLDMEWPLIYRGQTESADGHIFICDGYDNNDYFHINWGHGGGADGYFAIGSLYENQTNYSYINAAVFNSVPNYLFNEYNGNDELIYSINSDFMSVSVIGHVDGSSATGTLTIPETKTFNGITYPVTAIGNSAFSNCTGFTGSLTIPSSVTSIGSSAFYGCSGFTGSLTIPSSVTAIGNSAFEGCSGFTGSLIIPNSVTTIGGRAFEDCSGFTGSLTIPNSVTAIGYSAFKGCNGFTGSLTISNSVTVIDGYTFYNCGGFTEMLSIPNSVVSIGASAFEGCSGFSGSLTIPNSVLEIDANAFRGCSGLCGNLIIGSSVTSISYGVFLGCNGFTSIMSLAEIPPTLDNENPFNSWNSNTPVYVPCGFEEAYSSISWGGFSNFIEWCGGVDCSAPDELYATDVTENSATLTWTGDEDSYNVRYKPVSYEYDFEDGSLGGWTIIDADGDGYNWAVNTSWGGHGGSIGMVNSASYNIEVGVLYPDNYLVSPQISLGGIISFWACAQDPLWAGEHFGVAVSTTNNSNASAFTTIIEWTMTAKGGGAPTVMTRSGNRTQGCWYQYTVDLSAYAGQAGYVAIRHFDCSDKFYLDVDDIFFGASAQPSDWTVQTVTGSSLNINGLAPGTVYEWQVQGLNAICENGLTDWSELAIFTTTAPSTVIQSNTLSQGWNWWSTYIEQDGVDGLSLLEESLGDHGITIRSQVGYTDYYAGYGWYGSLSSISNESSYKIKTDAPCSVAMTGMEAVPSQHPIALSHGWTWMGYVSSTAMDVNEALSGFEAAEGDKLKSQQGYSEYYEGYGWFGSLNTFEPGMGLMYYSNSNQPKTLTYPEGERTMEQRANYTPDNNHWVPDMHAYPYNMTVTAVIELDGEELRSENYELAAFTNDECRGSVRLIYVKPVDRWVAFLTIAGEDAADLSFRLYDMENDMECCKAEETLNYEMDAMVGNMGEPYIVRFRNTASENELASHVSIFPNPANDVLTIRGEGIHSVTVLNMTGQSVDKVDADAVETLMLDVNDYEAGVYLLLVQSEYGSSRKMFVKR